MRIRQYCLIHSPVATSTYSFAGGEVKDSRKKYYLNGPPRRGYHRAKRLEVEIFFDERASARLEGAKRVKAQSFTYLGGE